MDLVAGRSAVRAMERIMSDPVRHLLTTVEAAAYCGFKSTSAIRKAKLEGRLTPAGRRGGKGTWMWSVDELDRFLVGAPAASFSADRPGTPPEGAVHGHEEEERMDQPMEELGQADPASERLAEEGAEDISCAPESKTQRPGSSRRSSESCPTPTK